MFFFPFQRRVGLDVPFLANLIRLHIDLKKVKNKKIKIACTLANRAQAFLVGLGSTGLSTPGVNP